MRAPGTLISESCRYSDYCVPSRAQVLEPPIPAASNRFKIEVNLEQRAKTHEIQQSVRRPLRNAIALSD